MPPDAGDSTLPYSSLAEIGYKYSTLLVAYVRYVKKATCREEREGTNRFPPLGKSWWDLPFPSLFDKRERALQVGWGGKVGKETFCRYQVYYIRYT